MSRLAVVDAFTTGPFSGNPAAVVLLDHDGGWPPDEWMQHVAAQLALAETAFLGALQGDSFPLRWFTPTTEANLCGHATLAAVHVLDPAQGQTVSFDTRSGVLTGRRAGHGFSVSLPADPSGDSCNTDAVAAAVGAPILRAGAGREYVVVELSGEAAVAGARPKLELVARLGRSGLVITAAGRAGQDVVCRMFAPQSGIPEDPVTGSAWCALAPWWQDRVGAAFEGRQLSARGGALSVRTVGNQVVLTGRTRPVLDGRLLV